MPSRYTLQQNRIRVGSVRYHGGLAVVSDGEYSGFPVAIKFLKMNEEDLDGNFRVTLNQLYVLPSLSFHPAVVSRDHQLETSVPSEHPAFVGRVVRTASLPHSH